MGLLVGNELVGLNRDMDVAGVEIVHSRSRCHFVVDFFEVGLFGECVFGDRFVGLLVGGIES